MKEKYLGAFIWERIFFFFFRETQKNTNYLNFLGGPVVKNQPANAEDVGLIPGLGRFHTSWGN